MKYITRQREINITRFLMPLSSQFKAVLQAATKGRNLCLALRCTVGDTPCFTYDFQPFS